MAYLSTFSLRLRESRVVVSDPAGRDLRIIAVRRPPESFIYIKPAWSPNGSRLVASGISELSPLVIAVPLRVLSAGPGSVFTDVGKMSRN